MKRFWNLPLWAVWGLITVWGCTKDDDNTTDPNVVLTDSEKVNQFIVDCVSNLYLWEADTDWTKYSDAETYRSYSDHNELFLKFINKEDRWSFLTDDIEGTQGQFNGVTTTYGLSLIFGRFSNKPTSLFAIVLYVYKGSPADAAGIKRGDIIVGLNGGDLTESNYTDLYYSSTAKLTMGVLKDDAISVSPTPVDLKAVNMYEDPVQHYEVINIGGKKIGYLCYTGYQQQSEGALKSVFADFKSQGVSDVVLDLRYNGGGYAITAQKLASILAPQSVVKSKDVYLSRQWNALYTEYFKNQNTEYFIDTLNVNMNLNCVYALVTGNTASASEATLIGLKPYMDVVLIGDTTHGKYCGAYLMGVMDFYEDAVQYKYQNISNWGMYIMVYRYANKSGYPTFVGGLPPEVRADEDYFDLKDFGDVTDPLLAVAVERITGVKPLAARSASGASSGSDALRRSLRVQPELTPRPRGFGVVIAN